MLTYPCQRYPESARSSGFGGTPRAREARGKPQKTMPSRPSGSTARAAHAASTRERSGSHNGSTQAHLRPSGLFLMKVLIHSDVTDFGRCQKKVDKRQKEQIAEGGSHGVVARTNASANTRAVPVPVPARGGQPTKVGTNAGQGGRLAPPEAGPARGPRRAAQARPRRGRRRRGPCSSRTARGHSACGRGRRWGRLLARHGRCSSGRALCQAWLVRWRARRE